MRRPVPLALNTLFSMIFPENRNRSTIQISPKNDHLPLQQVEVRIPRDRHLLLVDGGRCLSLAIQTSVRKLSGISFCNVMISRHTVTIIGASIFRMELFSDEQCINAEKEPRSPSKMLYCFLITFWGIRLLDFNQNEQISGQEKWKFPLWKHVVLCYVLLTKVVIKKKFTIVQKIREKFKNEIW